jgi:filamentous hemagglutinin family protein
MNRIYRLVWNATSGLLVVVAENAKGRGKSTSGRKLVAAALALSGGLFLTPLAMAGPVGGQISAGAGAISQAGANTTITQTSQNMAINWQSFGIAANESVRFNQPSATSIALNRILGQSPSQIFGSLSANGQVFLLNPNGVLFAPGSQVNVGGLVASTLGLSDADFMAGKFSFSKGSVAGTVVNQGTLTAAQGGYIALLAPEVRNEGVISATMGTALLAAGDKVSINLNKGSLLSYNIDQGAINALADNKQLIQADGGQVFMSAKAADALSIAVVNNTGIVEARTVQNVAGTIRLMSDMSVGTVNLAGKLDASAANGGNGGFIETSAAHVKIADSARITTAAPKGKNGTWLIDPVDFTIAATSGDMTGAALSLALDPLQGGGNVTIMSTNGLSGTAGDVNVNDTVTWADTVLTLNAQNNININNVLNGSGLAKLVLQYGQGAVAAGNLSKYTLGATGQVWLNAGQNFTTILGSDLVTTNYTVINSVGLAASVTGADLQGINGNLAGNYVLGGTIDATATSTWNAGLGFAQIGTTATPFTGNFDGLGHSILNLVINRPLVSQVGLFGVTSSTAAVRNVGLSAGSISGLSEVGGLIGVNNGTLDNSYSSAAISAGVGVATGSYAGGLVGINWGSVSKSYANGAVVAAGNYAGGLVGANYGAVDTSYATGAVSGAGMVGGLTGGNLNGLLSGAVTNSYATGAVTGTGDMVGGLVGLNNSSITNSYATGVVSGASYAGGLVGHNSGSGNVSGSVTNSYATGAVTATVSLAGGLVGENNFGAGIANSYATGAVSSVGDNVGGLVGSSLVGSAISNSYATGTANGLGNVGGLVGKNSGAVANSYASGAVTGSSYVGGLVGSNYGTVATANTGVINNSYASGSVTGTLDVGGLVGDNNRGAITNAYATGLVTGTTAAGGLVGTNSGTVGTSFWDTTTSGQLTSAGGVGMATADMHTAANFTSATVANGSVNPAWDMTNTWIGYDGFTSPLLRSFMTALTVTANSVVKTYDGLALAGGVTYSVTPTVSLLGTLSYGAASSSVNAGSYAVSLGGLYSAQQGGYIISYANNNATLTINKATLTATIVAANKVYDGTTTAASPTFTLAGLVAGESLNVTGGATFNTKDVATANLVTVNSVTLADGVGGLAGNYTLAAGQTAAANITPATLTVGATGVNRVYDGLTGATVSFTDNRYTGDVLTLSGTASFADKNVAAAKAVSVTGITVTGTDAANYTFNATAATTADITPKALSVSGVTASNKVYDGTTSATVDAALAIYTGLIAGDVVTANVSGLFADKNVANGKALTLTSNFTGADAANYSIAQQAGLTANITPATLTVGATGVSRVYDGLTSAAVSYTDNRIAGDVLTFAGTASFSDKNVATAKAVSVTGISATGTDAGNYTFNTTASTTADITARALTVSATGANKIYDGLTGATVTYGDNRVAGDVLTFTGSASFADKNVATAKAVNVSGIALTGTDAGNYTLNNTTAATTADITPKALTVTGVTASNKVYDGSTAATINTTGAVYSGLVAGDVVTANVSGLFADKNVANGKTVTLNSSFTGTDAGNYTIAQLAGLTANITPATLTVSATGVNKVYDGLTGATVNYSDNRIAGDVLNFTGTASFADKNVAAGKTVSVSGVAATGADAANYTFNTTASTTANITAKALTVSATGVNKVYDGLAGATVTLGDNRIANDVLTLAGTASFADKNVAAGKTVNVSGIAVTGTDAGNYTFNTTAAATADITPKALTVTGVTANNKVYDGTTAATINTASAVYSGLVAGDVVTANVSGLFADKNVANGKTVTLNSSFTGTDAGNYTIAQLAGLTANITPASLTVSATGVSRVYDGLTGATVNYSDNRIAGDALTLGGAASFADKNVANGKAVSVSGITVTGTDSANYTFNTTAATTANITAKALTVSATGVNKVYDGLTVATATLADNRIAGDVLSLAGTASFADKNVANGKAVGISGISVTGTDAANYTFNTTASTTANITAAALTISATGVNKVYDGLTGATVTYGDNRIAGDVLNFAGTASFADKNVATAKAVGVTGISVTGADAGNYTFNTTAATTANITARALTVSATGVNKVYDGLTTAAATLGDNRIAGDVLTLGGSASFADKNVATGKTVGVTSITVTGTDAANYTFNTTAATTANITAKALTVSATGVNKVYDGLTGAVATLADNRIAGDVLTLGGAASFANKNVGTGKAVGVSGITVTGTDAANYTFNTTAATTANITAATLTVSATGVNKVYDGLTGAAVTYGDNRIAGDVLTFTGTAGFADKNVAAAKAVSVSGITLGGADAGNYTFNTTAAATADITARALTVSAAGVSKVYDGLTNATATLSDNRIAGDVLTLAGTASFADKNAATAKAVSVSGIAVTGTDAANYTFNATAATTADITVKQLTVTGVTASNKVYDGATATTVSAAGAAFAGIVAGDVVTTGVTGSFADKNVANGKSVALISNFTGADAANYSLAQQAGLTANITPASLTVSATGVNKVYDALTSGSVIFTDNRIAGDVLTLSGTASFADKNVATAKALSVSGISLSGADAGNYTFNTTAATTANITPANLAVTGITADNKIYDGSAAATLAGTAVVSPLGTDVVTVSGVGTGMFADANAANGKLVTISGYTFGGADMGNYNLLQPQGVTANIWASTATPASSSVSAALTMLFAPEAIKPPALPVATTGSSSANNSPAVSLFGNVNSQNVSVISPIMSVLGVGLQMPGGVAMSSYSNE